MKRSAGYLDSMLGLISGVCDKLGAKILLIPNEYGSDVKVNDKHVARKIFESAGSKDIEIVDVDSLTPNQVKAVIAACDVMVCARYHSVVASLSSEVPLLVLSWHHKYREVMKLFELEEYVVEKESGGGSVVRNFFQVYDNRVDIKAKLHRNLPVVKNNVRAGAEAFFNTIRSYKKAPIGKTMNSGEME
jgi:polysaccharide pyruvyl transferase WcaK-like protein